MKNILHISDIHVSATPNLGMPQYELKKLFNNLITDIKDYPEIDTLFITGDIANSGTQEEYEIFNNDFLLPLLTELGLDSSRVITVPGNHDSDRGSWKESEISMRDNLTSNLNQNRIEKILKEAVAEGIKRLSSYSEFKNVLDANSSKVVLESNCIYSVYSLDNVGIGCVNSAWLAYERDREKLIIGEYQLRTIITALKQFDQKILLLHHPLDWLHPDDRKVISELIHSSKIKCIFYGHMHEFNMFKESHFEEDSVLKLQAGRFDVSKKDNYGGYSILQLETDNDLDNGKIIFRKYDYKTESFTKWNERVDNGESKYSLTNLAPFDTSAFADASEKKMKKIEFDLLCNTGLTGEQRKKLSDIFIMPTIMPDDDKLVGSNLDDIETEVDKSEQKKPEPKKPDSKVEPLTIFTLVNSQNSYVILGSENSGKTTVAKKILLTYLNEQSRENIHSIVYYLDLKCANLNSLNQIKNQLVSFYADEDGSSVFSQKLEDRLKSSNAVIILDSIESLNNHSLKQITKFITENYKAKYFLLGQLSSRAAILEQVQEISKHSASKLKFELLNIKGIQRSHVRELFKKWTNGIGTNDKTIQNALRLIDTAGMPNNPFVYTMLLSITDRKHPTSKAYMHEADLVENFIEVILQKHIISLDENTPQYKDILLMLGFVADQMHKQEVYKVSENDLYQYAITFNGLITQDFSINSYVNPIVNSGIIIKEQGGYVFSQSCFFNYVYANWIDKNDIRNEILDTELGFTRFDKVIEYLSALRKSDISLLQFISKKVEDAWIGMVHEENLEDIKDANQEISNVVSHDLIDIINPQQIESSLNGDYGSEQDHDKKLDDSKPLSTKPKTIINDGQNNVNSTIYFHELLSLYARTYRAAEHIMVKDITSFHFQNLLSFYMRSIAFNVRIFDKKLRPALVHLLKNILEYESLDVNNKKAAIHKIEAFINFTIAMIPNWEVSMMSSDFFNQRQKLKITNFRESVDDNLTKILLTYCLSELDSVDVVKEIKSQKYEKPHESSSLMLKIIELCYAGFSLKALEKKELEDFLKAELKKRKLMQSLKNFSAISTIVGSNIDTKLLNT